MRQRKMSITMATKYRNPSKRFTNSVDARIPLLQQPHKNTDETLAGESHQKIDFCKICGDGVSSHVHYGGRSCMSCRAFFRRSVERSARYFQSCYL